MLARRLLEQEVFGGSWSRIKNRLRTEGAVNRTYDPDEDGFADKILRLYSNVGCVRRSRVSGADWSGACSVAFSPDGKYVAVASFEADAVEIMRVPTLERVSRICGSDFDGVSSVAFSPDGKYVAVASCFADAVEIMRVPSLERISRVSGADWDYVHSVAFSPDGKYIAAASCFADAVEIMQGLTIYEQYPLDISMTVGAGSTAIIPPGIYIVFLAANTSVEAYDSASASWRTVISAGGSGYVISDGTLRLNNAGAADETSSLRKWV